MASISFLLTNNCNLRCKYCYQKDIKSDIIYNKTSENVIDAFAEYCKNERIHDVKLFGGEPLLYKNLFIYCVLKLKQIDPNIQIYLVTNGTLVDTGNI